MGESLTVDFAFGGEFDIPDGVQFVGGVRGNDELRVRSTGGNDSLIVANSEVIANDLSVAWEGVEKIRLIGDGGDDTYRLWASGVNVVGTQFDDTIFGNAADNTLIGGGGDDWLFGGCGNDELWGGHGDDWLFGGFGDDELRGGPGWDYLFGGPGVDLVSQD